MNTSGDNTRPPFLGVTGQSMVQDRIELERDIQESDALLAKPNPFDLQYQCACGNIFTHSRVPKCCVSQLKCEDCR